MFGVACLPAAIAKYATNVSGTGNSLRFYLTTDGSMGMDLRFDEEKILASWNYINKIWNISRFISMNLKTNNYQNEEIDYNNLTSIDKWILDKYNSVVAEVTDRKIVVSW